MKPDGIQRGGASYPGKPDLYCHQGCYRWQNTNPTRRSRSGEGTAGGRFTGSTDESGPMKPGNSVEEKTLRIRKGEARAGRNQCHRADPRPDFLGSFIKEGEVVDERWQ